MSRALVALAILVSPALARADGGLQPFLEHTLAAERSTHRLPAVAALVQIDGQIAAEAAVGVRALGHPESVTLADRWHLGSDTKAFTATLVARLVEQGVMRFDDTLAASFPAFAAELHPAYRQVTVAQLLSHTAGLPPLTEGKELPAFLATIESAHGVVAQRAAAARHYLTRPPAFKAGDFEYSNLGYVIAAAIAEARTGTPWEQLVRTQIFAPLGITQAGFGAPGRSGRFDQPQGHRATADGPAPLDPADRASDNPPALGPAGTINMALRDWLLFAQDQLDGVHGRGKLLKAETYRQLQTPVTNDYALGWGVRLGPDGAPLLLAHAGSNGFWFAEVRILPRHGMIFLVATNVGGEAATQSAAAIVHALTDRLRRRNEAPAKLPRP